MDERSEETFLREMADKLKGRLQERQLTYTKQEREARIFADAGARRWSELKDYLKNCVEKINKDFDQGEPLAHEAPGENQLRLRHQLSDRFVRIDFNPTLGMISYTSPKGTGKFLPSVQGDSLGYEWDEGMPWHGRLERKAKPSRMITFEDDLSLPPRKPKLVETWEMAETLLRCAVHLNSEWPDK